MNKYKLLILITFISSTALAGTLFEYDGSEAIINIAANAGIYEDPTNLLEISEVLEIDSFVNPNQMIPNFGVSSSTFWIEFTIRNTSGKNDILLELGNPLIDMVDLYSVKNDQYELMHHYGDMQPYKEREFDTQNFLFDLKIENQAMQRYVLKLESWEQISFVLAAGNTKSIYEANSLKDLIYGLFFGIILALLIYNVFIFITVRDRSYLFYVIYLLFIALTQATLQGYTFRFLWPNMPQFVNHSLIIFPGVAGVAALEFMKLFMKTKKYTPYLHKGLNVIVFLYAVAISCKLLNYNRLAFEIVDICAIVLSLYAFVIAITISAKGYRPAKFFLLAWSILFLGVIAFVLRSKGILPANNFTNYAMPTGTVFEVLLLSFALADRINIFRKEKEEAQEKMVEALKENESIIKEQNVILEQKVEKRTLELNKTLSNLKEAQSQLVDAEKMSSLGQLTAGIAHEINNPINFVSSNITPLRQDIEDVNAILEKYKELETTANVSEKLKEIENLKQELDFEYLQIELGTIIDGIEDGAKRTAEIVSGLRSFSRLDEGDLKEVNINDGIQATLLLIKSKLNGIRIEKSLGSIPDVECNSGKINQLVMNLIDNSIYAINKNNIENKDGVIGVRTEQRDSSVRIIIEDNGIGIPENIKDKLFDPFFTTKDVGEGTGLGLSIVRSIIDSHKGKVKVISEVNKGTEISVEIPIKSESYGKN